MNLRRQAILLVAALTMAACGKSSRKVESRGDVVLSADAALLGTRRGPIGLTDHQVLTWLTESHRGEVELGEFARERAADEEIRTLGNELRVDHGRLVREGGMLSKQLSRPNSEDSSAAPQVDSLTAAHARAMNDLRKLNGDALDRALAKTLVLVHERTLDTLRKWNGKALDPKLNTAMEKAEPIVERHLGAARLIEERLKKSAKARVDSIKAAVAKAEKARKDSTARALRETSTGRPR